MVVDLKNALDNIKNKIASSADSASPEELAYLGTAIDKIGGRATVLEVFEVARAGWRRRWVAEGGAPGPINPPPPFINRKPHPWIGVRACGGPAGRRRAVLAKGP